MAKYTEDVEAIGAKYMIFAVEATDGLSESAQQLIQEIHHHPIIENFP